MINANGMIYELIGNSERIFTFVCDSMKSSKGRALTHGHASNVKRQMPFKLVDTN